MNFSVLTISFKTAPVALREKLAVPSGEVPALLGEIREKCLLEELMLVSTCNRMEIYFADDSSGAAAERLRVWLNGYLGEAGLEDAAALLSENAALTHLFRVACGLESMVLGEPQVLGQVKQAYQATVDNHAQGPILTGLMPRVFHAAKRVRTETQVARFPVSVSFVAVQLARRIFDTLENKTVMVVGAGDMAELTVTHLKEAGIRRLMITNRTYTNAVALAERAQGSAVRFEEIGAYLPEADIVISSTGAQEYIITPELVRMAVKQRRGDPMFFIDIAVPRDVDPEVNQLSNVYCFDIDDLQSVADANMQQRERAAGEAQQIIGEEVARYERWRQALSVVPAVKALRRHFSEVGEAELADLLEHSGDVPPQQAEQLRKLARRIVNKLLHTPSTRLKEMGSEANGPLYVDALTDLFDLPAEPEPSELDAGNVVRLPVTARKPR